MRVVVSRFGLFCTVACLVPSIVVPAITGADAEILAPAVASAAASRSVSLHGASDGGDQAPSQNLDSGEGGSPVRPPSPVELPSFLEALTARGGWAPLVLADYFLKPFRVVHLLIVSLLYADILAEREAARRKFDDEMSSYKRKRRRLRARRRREYLQRLVREATEAGTQSRTGK